MNIPYTILSGALCLCCNLLSAQSRDSLTLDKTTELGNKFTVEIRNVKLDRADQTLKVVIRHAYNSLTVGSELLISPVQIQGSTPIAQTLVADGLYEAAQPHTYTITSNNTLLSVYRDHTLLGRFYESTLNEEAGISLVHDNTLTGTYETHITPDVVEEPDERALEENVAGMLPATCPNLIADPFFNRGFTRTGDYAEERTFFSQQAIYSGWGADATIDNQQAWSGKHCLRINGQAVRPSQGASVETAVKFAANTPYYIRAMVKSEGYEGKIGIQSNSCYLHITDTKGEWKQLEGVLTPGTASEVLYINNADYDNNGTVWIDNLEVYRGYESTASTTIRQEIPYVNLAADEFWSPRRNSNVYMLGFTDNGTEHSTVDTTKVSILGGTRLTKTVAGSQMYALSFPGPLRNVQTSGWYDGVSHTDELLYPGVDFVLQRYEYPRFQYVDEEEISEGCYIVQFVDNLDGLDVTMTFGAPESTGREDHSLYRLQGNNTGTDLAPEGVFLKFSEKEQKFERTQAESVKPFEAYITTTADAPVYQIVPNGTATALKRIPSTDGAPLSIQGGRNHITVHALEDCLLNIYAINGSRVVRQKIKAGHQQINLPAGIYLAGGQKVVVSR